MAQRAFGELQPDDSSDALVLFTGSKRGGPLVTVLIFLGIDSYSYRLHSTGANGLLSISMINHEPNNPKTRTQIDDAFNARVSGVLAASVPIIGCPSSAFAGATASPSRTSFITPKFTTNLASQSFRPLPKKKEMNKFGALPEWDLRRVFRFLGWDNLKDSLVRHIGGGQISSLWCFERGRVALH